MGTLANFIVDPICRKAKYNRGEKPLLCFLYCPYKCKKEYKMASTNLMLEQVSGMIDTKDLNDWEHEFVTSVWERSEKGKRPDKLSSKQVEILERIWKKHFAG